MGMTQQERQNLDDLVFDFILNSYITWRLHRQYLATLPEPNLTGTLCLDYALQHGECPLFVKHSVRRRQHGQILSVLRRLKRLGKITSSYGAGERGRETRCYEPAVKEITANA